MSGDREMTVGLRAVQTDSSRLRRGGVPAGYAVLGLLFFGSGAAALVYEIVWLQLLQLVIGSTAVSLGLLLGVYMGALCLGSLFLPRFIPTRRHPLLVYGLLELGIGAIGLAVLFGIPAAGQVYAAHAGRGLTGMVWRGLICAVCLVPPTLLMGATLPVAARWVEATPRGRSWLGLLYAANLVGAMVGCLFAGFYLLRLYDTATATYLAAAVNGSVAVGSLGLARLTARPAVGQEPAVEPTTACDRSSWRVYVAIALSGMAALGGEVVWTRLLSLLLGGTVYTFSIILAVFLLGLGIGGGLASWYLRGAAQPRPALGWCQFALAAGIAWAAWMVSRSLPYWPVNPSLARNPWMNFQIDFVRCGWALLPATILWGASFPLAVAAVVGRTGDPGRAVGGVYAANTLGAILGAVGTSLLLIAWLGTQHAQRVLVGISVVAGLWALAPTRKRPDHGESEAPLHHWPRGALRAAALVLPTGAAALLAWTVPQVPGDLIAFGRYLPTWNGQGDLLYVGEGVNASVAVSEWWDTGVRNFHVSGKVEASSEPQDMRLQLMLGHLPALMHPQPRSVLIVGFGAGVTAGTFVLHPDIQRIVICEIEPLIPRVVAPYFAFENHDVLRDPRVELVYDDARHYLLTSRERFDIITSDPIHPWVKGAATLYTCEYFELVKQHLNPGGLVTQWVPLYESTEAVVKSEMATFFAVFPRGTLWSNDRSGLGYDTLLLGSVAAQPIDVDAIQARLDRTNFLSLTLSLDSVGFKSAADLLATYAGRGADLKPWLAPAVINRDRDLRLQYLAGLGLNANESGRIYEELLSYRTFPQDLLVGSTNHLGALRTALRRPGAAP